MRISRHVFFIVIAISVIVVSLSFLSAGKQVAFDAAFDAQKSATQISEYCKGERRCYQDQFASLTKLNTLKEAVSTMYALQKINSSAPCHAIAHAITSTELEKNPTKWLEIFSKVDPNVCDRGFYHGIIEGYIKFNPSFVLDENAVAEICKKVQEKTHGRIYGSNPNLVCGHAMGHLILVGEGADVARAVSICEKTPDSIQGECSRGVFMEWAIRDMLIEHGLAETLPWNEKTIEEMETMCLSNTGSAATGCWKVIAYMYDGISGQDPKLLYSFCSRAKEPADRDECYIYGVANMVSTWMSSKPTAVSNIQNSSEFCDPFLGNKEMMRRCMGKIIYNVVAIRTSFTPRLVEFCDNVSANYQPYCHKLIAVSLQNFTTQEQQDELCKDADSGLTKICKKTNPISVWYRGLALISSFFQDLL